MKTKLSGPFANAYSTDKRKRRRQHRINATYFAKFGGSISEGMRFWHLQQARYVGR